jgi:Mrp family chromosome partitioning ATPase
MISILLAAPDLSSETALVASAPGLGLRITRRCVDAVDLLAAAGADRDSAIVLSAGLPRLTHDVVARIVEGRVGGIVGLAESDGDRDRLGRWGVGTVVLASTEATGTIRDLRAALDDRGPGPDAEVGVWPTGVWSGTEPPPDPAGRLLAVWGPMGAPGRTTVAIGVAEALAERGLRVLLVDADTYAPSVAMALGLVEDASGLIVAGRHAEGATLRGATLLSLCHSVRRDWYVLGGMGRPDRWADLRPAALDRIWVAAREEFDVTVVDVGFCLESDEGGAWSTRRNAATLSALGVADDVLAVADASPLGAARLVGAWPSLASVAPSARRTVVRNRATSLGDDRRRGWSAAVADLGVTDQVHGLPTDRRALDRCWAGGRSLGEGAPRSSLRRALAALAGHLVSG